jgi:thiol:disulfide interchange protein DsbD
MMGFYEMYIPRFMQPGNHKVKGGSFISVFIFGAISGIVASPCLSPGLVCLLCMVTTWGNALLGFVTLFAFGLGLSVPLLVIGTFSNSLSLLPRAGMWMVEIKKLFGLFMLFMCGYFLMPLFAEPVMAWILAAIVFACGLLLVYFARHTHSKGWRYFYNIIGILTIAFGVYCTYVAYFLTYLKPQLQQTSTSHEWESNYATARHRAGNKLMLVDIGAPYCSICKSIDAKLLHNPQVEAYLKENVFPVKINGGNSANDYLLNQFHVMGFPTILLVNPKTEEIVKRWGPELNDVSPEAFIQELKNIR